MKLQTAFLSFALLSVGMVSSNGGKQTQSSNADSQLAAQTWPKCRKKNSV
jgi:hypothetical protein